MSCESLQEQCMAGQQLLAAQEYVEAEQVLIRAESEALKLRDWDTLARLYMPLQEARRQRRQRTLQGLFCLDLISEGPDDHIEGRHVLDNYPHGTLLVSGWGTIEPALQARKLQARFKLYADVLLGATYPLIGGGQVVVVIPHEHAILPPVCPRRLGEIGGVMPAHSLVFREGELPEGPRQGTPELISRVQGWWEQLHWPYMVDARDTRDLRRRIGAYRRAIEVDYSCELAHQELCDTARQLTRAEVMSPSA
jgi:hypothetical protein